jgi:hypothetical protein
VVGDGDVAIELGGGGVDGCEGVGFVEVVSSYREVGVEAGWGFDVLGTVVEEVWRTGGAPADVLAGLGVVWWGFEGFGDGGVPLGNFGWVAEGAPDAVDGGVDGEGEVEGGHAFF